MNHYFRDFGPLLTILTASAPADVWLGCGCIRTRSAVPATAEERLDAQLPVADGRDPAGALRRGGPLAWRWVFFGGGQAARRVQNCMVVGYMLV